MDKFEEFYKQNCLDHFGYDPDLNWIFEKHEDGSYIQIEVENAKKVFQHQQSKVEELKATIKGNHGRIAELERLNRVKAQAIIDLHQEITELKASHHGEVIGHEVHFKKIKQERDELQTLYAQQGINMLKMQKRVDKAIRFLVEAELYQSEPNIDLAVKALKGEGQ
ncbi:hypothetical protein ACG9H6_16225 [Acinetobacter baumannii]|uniref:hypothetical protein n=1 Tax=Acinetobacter baumannii TaxID=470 RepID=UPI003AF8D754